MNSTGLHWAFMKIHELGTKGYLKSLADKIRGGSRGSQTSHAT